MYFVNNIMWNRVEIIGMVVPTNRMRRHSGASPAKTQCSDQGFRLNIDHFVNLNGVCKVHSFWFLLSLFFKRSNTTRGFVNGFLRMSNIGNQWTNLKCRMHENDDCSNVNDCAKRSASRQGCSSSTEPLRGPTNEREWLTPKKKNSQERKRDRETDSARKFLCHVCYESRVGSLDLNDAVDIHLLVRFGNDTRWY